MLFDFSAGDAGSWGFSGSSGQLCLTSYSNCFAYPAIGTYAVGGNGLNFSVESGTQVIGSAVPEPSSLALIGRIARTRRDKTDAVV